MAKLEIRSIELIAPRSRKAQITDYLQRKGAVEVTVPPETDGMTFGKFTEQTAQAQQQLSAIRTGLTLLQTYAPRKKPLTAMLEPRKPLTAPEIEALRTELDETVCDCERLAALDKESAELKADNIRLNAVRDSLLPWQAEQNPVRAGHTGRIAFMTGLFRDQRSYEEIFSALATLLPDRDCVEAEILSAAPEMTCVTVYCLREDSEEVGEALRSVGFVPAPETPGQTPAEKLAEVDERIGANEARIREIAEEISGKAGTLYDKAEAAEDLLTVRLDQLAAFEKIPETERVFRLTGYLAARDADRIKQYIESHFEAAVEISVPPDDEDVPVILSNSRFSAPLEGITGSYSLPSKADLDPTPMMAFFYYLFFGMMLSDAGYGLIIALGTGGLLLFKKNMEEKMKRTLRMYLFCGLSTVFWGAMYGSWFGDAPAVICREFLHKDFNPLPPVWTDAVTDTMNVLIACFILGLAHLFWGVCVKGINDIKHGSVLDALCDTIPTFLTVIGIAPVFFGLFVQETVPENYPPLATFLHGTFLTVHHALNGVWKYILLTGVALVILTAGRSAKNIVGKLGGGLYGVYNLFSGYLGDVLSYARLLALGMATGVIGQVMNMLGTMPQNPVLKAIVFIPVFLIGHLANLAINIIGAYVHTNRLQYVEFFSKFYEGGGRAFAPLEANTKYYKFKEEL